PGLAAAGAVELRITREADGADLRGSPVTLAAGGVDAAAEGGFGGLLGRVAESADEDRALAFLTRETERLLARRAARDGDRAGRDAYRRHRRRWGAAAPAGAAAPDAPRLRALVIDERVPDPTRDAGSVALLSHMQAL